MSWWFKKKKKSILSLHKEIPVSEEEKKKLEEEAKKKSEAYRVVQIVEDPTTGGLTVNCIQNIRTQIEASGILFKGLLLMAYEFFKAMDNKNRIIRPR